MNITPNYPCSYCNKLNPKERLVIFQKCCMGRYSDMTRVCVSCGRLLCPSKRICQIIGAIDGSKLLLYSFAYAWWRTSIPVTKIPLMTLLWDIAILVLVMEFIIICLNTLLLFQSEWSIVEEGSTQSIHLEIVNWYMYPKKRIHIITVILAIILYFLYAINS